VVNDDDNNRERTEKIETRLALAILKAGINSELSTASLRPEWRCGFRHEASVIRYQLLVNGKIQRARINRIGNRNYKVENARD
jgi:hypothetical protein